MSSAAVRFPASIERRPYRGRDRTFYPVEEKVGEDSLQTMIAEQLRPLIERWYVFLGKPTFVGADQFIYYKQFHPGKVVAPDVYVLPGVPPGRRVRSWKVWKTGIVPDLAIEIVSSREPYKDYADSPSRYDELGVKELIIFDPDWERGGERVRWQRYRRLKRRGFVRVERTDADRIYSRVLGCWLRCVGEGDMARLRLGTGPQGDGLFPTAEEAAQAAAEAAQAAADVAQAAAEAERTAKETERTAKETERTAKEEALAAKEEALAAKNEALAAKDEALQRIAELEALLAPILAQRRRP